MFTISDITKELYFKMKQAGKNSVKCSTESIV
jgi:hypothetical protein